MVTRRSFLKYTGSTALTLFAFDKLGIAEAIAQIPGGTLDPLLVPKFQTPLLIPPVMPRAGTFNRRTREGWSKKKRRSRGAFQSGSPCGGGEQPAFVGWQNAGRAA